MNKTKVLPYPRDGEPSCSHLQPVVDYLINNGNKSVNTYVWGNNRTGIFVIYDMTSILMD